MTAIDNIVAPKIELAIRSINSSSGRDVTSVSANSERREHGGINPPFVSASEDNNLLSVTNINDEPRYNTQDAVSELSATGIHFDRQSHTHHMASGASNEIHHNVICYFIHVLFFKIVNFPGHLEFYLLIFINDLMVEE